MKSSSSSKAEGESLGATTQCENGVQESSNRSANGIDELFSSLI